MFETKELEVFKYTEPEDFFALFREAVDKSKYTKEGLLYAYKNEQLYGLRFRTQPETIDYNLTTIENPRIINTFIIFEGKISTYFWKDRLIGPGIPFDIIDFVIQELKIVKATWSYKNIETIASYDKYFPVEYSFSSFDDGFGGCTGPNISYFGKLEQDIAHAIKGAVTKKKTEYEGVTFLKINYENPEKNYCEIMIRTKLPQDLLDTLFQQ